MGTEIAEPSRVIIATGWSNNKPTHRAHSVYRQKGVKGVKVKGWGRQGTRIISSVAGNGVQRELVARSRIQ